MTDALRRIRRGLSLLELLLTLAISGVLLAAVSSSILVHYQTMDAGERLIDQARTAQAWNRKLRCDLALISRNAAVSWGDSIPASRSSVRERVLDFGYSYSFDAVSIWGDKQQLTINRMVVDENESSGQAAALVQETIIYTDQPLEKCSLPFTVAQQGTGLVRLRNVTGRNQTVARAGQIRGPVRAVVHLNETPQVVELSRFPFGLSQCTWRYFDGSRWLEQWDSRSQRGLPVAIEATIRGEELPTGLRFTYYVEPQERKS